MANIPQKPVIANQVWINGQTKLNQTNLTNGVNQNITNLKTAVDGIIDALGGPGGESASDKTLDQTSISAYDPATTYSQGQVVIQDGKYYRAKENGVTGTWDAAKWSQIALSTPVDSALDEDSTNPVQNKVVTVAINDLDGRLDIAESSADKIFNDLAPAYSASSAYEVGDYCIHDGSLYKCAVKIASGEAWNAAHWEAANVGDDLKGKITFGSSWFDGTGGVKYAEEAGLAEGIATDRTIDNPENSCPPITFGTVGGEAEIQTGINKFQTLFGNSKKWNQYVQTADKTKTATAGTSNTFGIVSDSNNLPIPTNHFIYLRCYQNTDLTSIVRNTFYCRNEPNNNNVYQTTAENNHLNKGWHKWVWKSTFDITRIVFWSNNPNVEASYTNFQVFDLTAMGFDTTGTEAEIIARFEKEYPAPYYPYNENAILSSKSASLISRGFNQWDEETKLGLYNVMTGAFEENNTRLCSKNPIEVLGNTQYFWEGGEHGVGWIVFFDANMNFISAANVSEGTGVFTTPANCKFAHIDIPSAYGTTYNHDICINLNQWGDTIDTSRNGEYVPYRSQTVTLPNIELRSIPGTDVKDEAYSVGGGKRRVGVINTANFTINNIGAPSYNNYFEINGLTGRKYNYVLSCAKLECASSGSWGYSDNIKRLIPRDNSASITFYNGNDANLTTREQVLAYLQSLATDIFYELDAETDIPESENPGWTENVYTDNWGTLEFTTDPVQNPQVPQPYFIEYTISLTEFLDSAYTRASGDANNLATEEELDAIRGGNDVVGKAKLADNLESNNKTALLSAYVFEQSRTDKADSILMDKIVGGDVAWNQLCYDGNFSANDWDNANTNQATLSISNNVATWTITGSSIAAYYNTGFFNSAERVSVPYNHKLLLCAKVRSSITAGVRLYALLNYTHRYSVGKTVQANTWTDVCGILGDRPSDEANVTRFKICYSSGYESSLVQGVTLEAKDYVVFDLTQMFGSAIANYLYNLETATPGAGVNKFRLLFPKAYYPYNAGELLPVRTVGRKAVGINLWDEEWELGELNANGTAYPTTNSIRSKYDDPIRVLPNTQYYLKLNNTQRICWYDVNDTFISVQYTSGLTTSPANAHYLRFALSTAYGATYKHDICVNLSDPSINGAFYPYVENTYPVEDVALHGIFKLDAGNNIVTNGDEYTPDGKVLRKFKKVAIGSLVGRLYSTNIFQFDLNFKTNGQTSANVFNNVACAKYGIDSADLVTSGPRTNKTVGMSGSGSSFYIYDTSYSTFDAIKAALANEYIIVEAIDSEQTEETHSPYASTQVKGTTQQWLEPEWTEEETPIMVPVGNQATLFDDLKKKVEIAADMPADDGTYVLNKSGGTNTYTPLETWLGNNGYNKMQVLSDAFGAKAALGGTLRQLLATKENIDFVKTDFIDLSTVSWLKYNDTHIYYTSDIPKLNGNGQILCSNYQYEATTNWTDVSNDRITINSLNQNIYIRLDDVNYAQTLKTLLQGVLLAYRKYN